MPFSTQGLALMSSGFKNGSSQTHPSIHFTSLQKKIKERESRTVSNGSHAVLNREGTSVCVCVQQVDSLSDSDGRFLSVDCQLILKAFHFALHLWDVPLLHDATVVYTHKHTHADQRLKEHSSTTQMIKACFCFATAPILEC